MGIANVNKPFSENVIAFIQKRGLKQSYVAERAGMSAQKLNDMLKGRMIIKVVDIQAIANALEVDANTLFEKGE